MVAITLRSAALVLSASCYFSTAVSSALPQYVQQAVKRQVPADAQGVNTINGPNNVTIRYKEPGKEGVCETTPGVNSYSGYVDLSDDIHMFFWFFEARHDPDNAPLTLWLNGGPGSDSMIGLFQELGPCNVTKNLTSHLNPYSWSEESNLLFLSQPIGVGFSYAEELVGALDNQTGLPINSSNPDGRYSVIDPYTVDTTALAAIGTWHILQGFIENLPTLDATIKSRSFNLWTESYGGHYGPAFYSYFYDQNLAIQNGTAQGCELNMHTLGIINGIVSERIQAVWYPEMAFKNPYGIKAVNESIYEYMKMNYYYPEGCGYYLDYCDEQDLSTPDGKSVCAQATAVCRSLVESPYYYYSGRNPYDIRAKGDADIPPSYFRDYLNLASTQNALGVRLNYTSTSSTAVYLGFDYTGDFVYKSLLADLEKILDSGVRVALIYGDADYICNYMGGEAVSLQLDYKHKAEFAAAGYAPFVVDGVEYGESRQYGNFSFTRVYEAGHEVPYYQPKASLEAFRRIIGDLVISDGSQPVTLTYSSEGKTNLTHTESYTGYYTGQPGINDKRKL